MSNSNGSSNVRNLVYSGKQSLLPPKSPFPIISPSYVDYVPNSAIGARTVQKPREGIPHHQRTSSESVLVEEQPSWLDDLLNEPETPVRRAGHRRSSSDSFAYMDAAAAASNLDYGTQFGYKNRNLVALPSWGSQDLGHYRDAHHGSMYAKPNIMANQKNRAWDSQLNSVNMNYMNNLTSPRDNLMLSTGLSRTPQNAENTPCTANEKLDQVDAAPNNSKDASDKDECLSSNPSALETDTKRAKQQFAQRSRVRKLQYIAELERNVQALQTEGSEVSAELEFLNQQNLILGMENKALKQRLDSITQEQLIKYMEQEVLEREIGRLRALYQQQLQQPKQQQPLSNHRRSRSRDLDSQFANLSMKSQETGSSCEPASGPLRI